MRFEIGNMQLFGLDLGVLYKRGKRGLQDILPAGLAGAFIRPAPAIDAIVDENSVRFIREYPARGDEIVSLQQSEMELAADGALKTELLKSVKSSQLQLNLVMPEKYVMRRRIFLPKVTSHNLRNVVAFQISKLTPFSADKVFFDVVEVTTAQLKNDTVEVELIAILKADAQPWIDEIERLTGLVISRLTVAQSDDLISLDVVNLLPQLGTLDAWWLRLNHNSVLFFIFIVLLVIALATPIVKLRGLVIERKQEIVLVNEKNADLQIKRQELDNGLVALNYVLQQRGDSALPSKVLEELTRIIPDEIYINNLSIQKKTIVFSGIGTGVVDLIDLLNDSEIFEEAKFTASITRGGQGQDIFTASAQLVTGMGEQ